jgi:hypothetical protein
MAKPVESALVNLFSQTKSDTGLDISVTVSVPPVVTIESNLPRPIIPDDLVMRGREYSAQRVDSFFDDGDRLREKTASGSCMAFEYLCGREPRTQTLVRVESIQYFHWAHRIGPSQNPAAPRGKTDPQD